MCLWGGGGIGNQIGVRVIHNMSSMETLVQLARTLYLLFMLIGIPEHPNFYLKLRLFGGQIGANNNGIVMLHVMPK